MIALDTNLLVYAHRSGLAEHLKAREAIEAASRNKAGWAIPYPCVAEFWMVVTHASSAGRPSTPAQAQAFLANLLTAGAQILYPNAGAMQRLTKLASELNLRGPRIFDLQIASICRQAGARELWTHDHNFIGVPGLVIRDPIL